MANISHFTQTVNGVSTTYDIHDAGAVPLAGTNALAGSIVPSTDNAYELGSDDYNYKRIHSNLILGSPNLNCVINFERGGHIACRGTNIPSTAGVAGQITLLPWTSKSNYREMNLYPNGTWTWDGTACQIASDQRLKQQITEIDDKLLDAWENVELVQFKYNDAVSEKGDKARLHTGFVVQQIDSACKKHGVDISQYGLYCHEEYPQETEEVEVEQADGTKVKEKKVIREASEHYSLRYTEALIVECKYLRRCVERLTARIERLEKEREASK